jgi:hypothetical protein
LDSVSDLVARVDRVRQPIARIVEAELRDVADVDGFTARETIQNEIRSLGPAIRGSSSAASATASGGPGRRTGGISRYVFDSV